MESLASSGAGKRPLDVPQRSETLVLLHCGLRSSGPFSKRSPGGFNLLQGKLIILSGGLLGLVGHEMRSVSEFGGPSSRCKHVDRKMLFPDIVSTIREAVKVVMEMISSLQKNECRSKDQV